MWTLLPMLLLAVSPAVAQGSWGCQLPHDWRPQTEACRAELAEIIVFAKVLALHKETYSVYNYLPYQYQHQHDSELLYSAEIELLCDQAWGSMLEVPAGSRFNVSGLGYFPCFSYSVTENNSYYFFLRMDENYNILPHGVNFQDAIFPDVPENHRMFSSLFQFSNCSAGSQLLCSTVQKALFEEEERVQNLTQQVRFLEKANGHLRERVKTLKRQLRQAQRDSKDQQTLSLKQMYESTAAHPDQDTGEQKSAQSGRRASDKKIKT